MVQNFRTISFFIILHFISGAFQIGTEIKLPFSKRTVVLKMVHVTVNETSTRVEYDAVPSEKFKSFKVLAFCSRFRPISVTHSNKKVYIFGLFKFSCGFPQGTSHCFTLQEISQDGFDATIFVSLETPVDFQYF